MCSDIEMPGIINSCNLVATGGSSSHNCVTKENLGILRSIGDQRTIKQGNHGKL